MKKLEELGISPTPWDIRGNTICWIRDRDGFKVCDDEECYKDDEIRKANIHLIAAAPELYEALKCFVDRYDTSKKTTIFVLEEVMKKARKALAEAAGEEVE